LKLAYFSQVDCLDNYQFFSLVLKSTIWGISMVLLIIHNSLLPLLASLKLFFSSKAVPSQVPWPTVEQVGRGPWLFFTIEEHRWQCKRRDMCRFQKGRIITDVWNQKPSVSSHGQFKDQVSLLMLQLKLSHMCDHQAISSLHLAPLRGVSILAKVWKQSIRNSLWRSWGILVRKGLTALRAESSWFWFWKVKENSAASHFLVANPALPRTDLNWVAGSVVSW